MDISEIGKVIIKRRKSLKISQVNLYEISGVALRTIKAIEAGNGNPTIATLNKVINSLGLEIELNPKKMSL